MTEQRLTDEQRAELADMLPKVGEPETEWTMIRTSLARAILSADRGEPINAAAQGTEQSVQAPSGGQPHRNPVAAAPSTPQPAPELHGLTLAQAKERMSALSWDDLYGLAVSLFIQNSLHEKYATPPPDTVQVPRLSLDTDRQVFFYEQDHYYLSNFSAFRLVWRDIPFDTSEAAYHYEKFFNGGLACNVVARCISAAASAHEAFKIAEANKSKRRPDWDDVKVGIMRDILRAKANQHEYVRRKLLQTGDRELIENSWRDDYWGWGENRDGKNMLGRLWMEVRSELIAAAPKESKE